MSLPVERGERDSSSRPADRYRVKAAAIAHEIEQTRRKIDETLSALSAKLSPSQALHRARTVVKQHPLETALVVVVIMTGVVWQLAVRRRPVA
jgi:Protein of unknown function (DUF3618)